MNAKKNLKARLVIALVLAMALGLPSLCPAEEDTWTRKSDMPTARMGLSTSTVNGKIYAIGGTLSWGGNKTSIVEQYDPAMNTWSIRAPMPTARSLFSTCAVNGKIYAIGGTNAVSETTALSTVEEYDPATDTWTRKADMPTRRFDICAAATNGRIYVFGGSGDDGTRLDIVEQYDPATDTWTRKADMPTVRSAPSASAVYGKIYVIGGFTGPVSESARIYNTVEQYDPLIDTWTTMTPMQSARVAFATSAVGGKIYAFSGTTFTGYYSTVEEYDVATDTWTYKANIPTTRSNFSASEVNGKIYVIGGMTWGYTVISTVEEYDVGFTMRSLDFNGDGIVDCVDMCMLVDYWHTDEPLYDIAPPPFGDGIVDVQDLILLSEHLFEDYLAMPYWKLDEEEGSTAHDSLGVHDGTLHGEPLWLPTGGIVDGALQFDGIDDYISTDFILDPSFGPFSVFAWIQGGGPGQVIISQRTGAGNIWLGLDAQSGALMTGLVPPSSGWIADKKPLVSEFIITDDQWHHVGFVWDGSYRILYADGIEVAKDTAAQNSLKPADGGLHIGAGKTLDAGTFFSGLIDDIHIYNSVVMP